MAQRQRVSEMSAIERDRQWRETQRNTIAAVAFALACAAIAAIARSGTVGAIVFFGGVIGVEVRRFRRRRANREARKAALAPVVAEPLADGLVLGQDVESGKPTVLSDPQLAAHGLILGAAGSGKSITLSTILCDAIRRGLPVVAIDLKGSNRFGVQLQQAAQAAGREFQYFKLDGIGHWNPLQHGDATELKDKLISFERFTEPHYQRAAERYLQTAIQVLQQARPDRPVTLAAVVALLDPSQLQQLLKYVPNQMLSRVGPYLSRLNRDQKSAISGLQSRLALISESTPGAYLQPGDPPIDLRHALCGGNEVVYFGLNSSQYGKVAAQIAALVIQDLTTISGYRLGMGNQPLALVGVDEFSALDADNVLSLLARARESGISVLLATQEMADLERLAAGFRDQVLGIVGMTIAHRQSVPASADLIAKIIGTQTVWKHTEAIHRRRYLFESNWKEPTTLGSRREVEEFRIHPNVIKDLPTGRAVLITKTPVAAAGIVQVVPGPRGQNADGY
ncbi:MAG: DUF853 family protein [Solirubrobacterales bacterium]|nr:DUF853 family protein [Solirubrobacterales bacterium]